MLIAEAKAGNLKAIALIYHRVEGRAVARQEAGGLGEFSRVDLSQYSSEELRAFIKAVKPAQEAVSEAQDGRVGPRKDP